MSQPGTLYLNQCGMIHALGSTAEDIRRSYTAPERPPFIRLTGQVPDREILVARVPGGLPGIADDLAAYRCRNNQLLLQALAPIEEAVRAAITRHGAHRVGIVLGTSTSGISDGENALATRLETGRFPESYHHTLQEIGSVACFLAAYLGTTGPAYTISTACSSSAKAFASARNLIRLGASDAVIVGGVDTLCRLTLCGFSALEAVSPDPTNPMSVNRSGLTIGEGAAVFLLSREPGPVELLGVGESSDAHHISAPDPNGQGAETSMRNALEEAGLPPKDVDYINLHGTGTPLNDLMESRAIHRLFGESVPCSSTKAIHGHTLGAAGAVEAGICWLLCADPHADTALPVHHWDGCRDPELPPLPLVVADQSVDRGGRFTCLSNSFAFGGSNCSVLMGRRTETA